MADVRTSVIYEHLRNHAVAPAGPDPSYPHCQYRDASERRRPGRGNGRGDGRRRRAGNLEHRGAGGPGVQRGLLERGRDRQVTELRRRPDDQERAARHLVLWYGPLIREAARLCPRESSEMARLSPMTHSRPGGTMTLNDCIEGLAPGNR